MNLVPQALTLHLIPEYDLKRQTSANDTFKEIKKRLADGELKHIYHVSQDNDCDESVSRPCKKSNPKVLSTQEEKFILNVQLFIDAFWLLCSMQ